MYRSPLVRGPLQLAPFLRLFSSSPQTPPQTPSPTAAAGRLTFEVGVAFAGKTRRRGEQIPRGMSAFTDKEKVQWRDAMLNEWGPKTTTAGSAGVKKADAGEDFFFVREEREMTTLGVADGVGGWAESGVDPSVFSQALMYFGWQASAMPQLGPGGILQKAYDDTLAEKEVKAGSATACILQLNSESGICNSANLGDSGYSVIRNGNQFLEIPGAQQHYFNCPRQLAKVPHRQGYSSNISDQPKDADLFSVQLKEGDVLVLFTDGLSDNIHPQELILLLAQASQLTPPPSPASSTDSLSAPPPTPRGEGLAQKYADACLRYGQICMTAHDKVSPFQQAAAQEGYDFRGGKMDDFTVITVVVQRAD